MMKVHSSLSFAVLFALAMVIMAAGDVAAANPSSSSSSDITFVVGRRVEFQRLRSTSPQKLSGDSISMTKNVNRHGTSTITRFDGAATAVALLPRGGGGDIVVTPTLVAKIVTMLGGATGLLFELAPMQAMEQYGVPKDRASLPMTTFFTKACGVGIVSFAILAYSLLFTDQISLQSAGQLVYVPWALWHLDNALNNSPSTKKDKKDTPPQDPQVSKVMVGVCVSCMYLTGQDYGEKALMIQAVVWGLCGLQMVLAPMAAAKSWQVDMSKFDDKHGVALSNVGWSMVATWTTVTSMIKFDASPIDAFGYGCIVWGMMHATNCLLGKNKKIDVDDLKSWIWAFINFGASAYILSSSSSA